MLEDRALFEKVRDIIEQETAQVLALNAILRDETNVLQLPDAAGLAEVLDKKVPPLAAINDSKLARYSLLRAHNYAETEDAWVELIKALDEVHTDNEITLSNRLDILRGELMQSQTLNRVNSEIVSRSMFSVHQLLNILRGNLPENNLYSETGDTVNVSSKPSIASA